MQTISLCTTAGSAHACAIAPALVATHAYRLCITTSTTTRTYLGSSNRCLPRSYANGKGIVYTFTDRAQHQSNVLVERRIGQLNESGSSALLARDLPAYLWPEVYMARCHTQMHSSALQRELTKKLKEEEEDVAQQQHTDATTSTHGAGDEKRGEPGGKNAKATQQPSHGIPIREMILHLVFHRDVTDEELQRRIHQLKPWGVPCFACPRRDHMRHLET